MEQGTFDLVLSDYNLPRHTFPDILKVVRARDTEVPIIVVSGSIGEENAVALMRESVADFVFKGNLSRLMPAIQRELAAAEQQAARRESDQRFRDIVEVSGDWIWETDTEHRYTFFSSQEGGWADPGASLGKTRWEVAGIEPAADEHWKAHLADLGARRPFRNFLFSFVAPSGARHHISMSGVPVFERGGAFRGYRGTARDETRTVEAFWRAEGPRRSCATPSRASRKDS
jgi:PAS domain-containing protein